MVKLLREYINNLYQGFSIGLGFRYRVLWRENRYVIFNRENGEVVEYINLDDEIREFENCGIKLTDGEKYFILRKKAINKLYEVNNANNNLEDKVRYEIDNEE